MSVSPSRVMIFGCGLPVALEDAVLGTTLRVPTLTGAVENEDPAHVQFRAHLPPARKGLPGKKKKKGDILVTLEVRFAGNSG